MTQMRFVEADDEVAEFRQREPHWHLPSQYTALAEIRCALAAAFAGHHQRHLGISRLGATQKAKQRGMRLPLRHTVQIDAGVDGVAAARDALLEPAVEWRERKRFGRGRRIAPHRGLR